MTDHVDAKATETPRSPHRDALIDEMFSPPDSLLQVLRRRLTAGELVAARDRRVGAGMIGARAAGLVFADGSCHPDTLTHAQAQDVLRWALPRNL